MSEQPPPLFISPTEAARILGVTRWMVYTLIKDDEFPTRKLGGRILVEREPFLAYVEALPSAAEASA